MYDIQNKDEEIYNLLKSRYIFILNDDYYEFMNSHNNEENQIVDDFIKDKKYNRQYQEMKDLSLT